MKAVFRERVFREALKALMAVVDEGDAEVHDPHNLEGPRRWEWIRSEGHLACVWARPTHSPMT